MATITNFQLDVLASGVTGIHGPLTRVGSLTGLPTPNENMQIEFTTALDDSVLLSYEQLTNLNVLNRLLGQAGGIHERVEDLKTAIAAVYAVSNAKSAPHTYEDYVDIITVLRANNRVLKGYY